jgi:hypothetical protein
VITFLAIKWKLKNKNHHPVRKVFKI